MSRNPGIGLWLSLCIWFVAGACAQEIPPAKQTSLGLYLTATAAYQKWQADPEHIKVLDVRTLEEFIFVGHAPMSRNIPFAVQTHDWDNAGQRFAMQPNPDFIASVQEWAQPADTILVMCRSGGRSAMSVNALAAAGFTHVYNIVDGMEGDLVRDPNSPDHGKRLKNGWKNSGLPWTYEIEAQQVGQGHE